MTKIDGTRMDRTAKFARMRKVLVDLLQRKVSEKDVRDWGVAKFHALSTEQVRRRPTDPRQCDLRDLLKVLAWSEAFWEINQTADELLEICNGHSHDEPISVLMFEQAMNQAKHICEFLGSDAALQELDMIERLPSADVVHFLIDGYGRSMDDRQQLRDELRQTRRRVANLTKDYAALANERAQWAEMVANASEQNAQLEDGLQQVINRLALKESQIERLVQRIQELELELQTSPTYARLAWHIGHKVVDDVGRGVTAAGVKYLEVFPLSEEKAAAYEAVLHQEYLQAVRVRSFVQNQIRPIPGLDGRSRTGAVQTGGAA